jgi:hypothetical protein
MALRCLAAVVFAAACTNAGSTSGDAAAADADPTTTYKGHLDATQPLPFGGQGFCNYLMTLEQLEVEVAITASGQVPSAHVQDENVEALAVPCGDVGTIPRNTATYDLDRATPSTTGIGVTFTAGRTNEPTVTLAANLTRTVAGYAADLVFHRFGQPPILNWTIYVSVELAPQ